MKKVQLLDFCLPDYFSGYPIPVAAVPVWSTMTNKEVAQELENELDFLADFGVKDNDLALYESYIEELLKKPEDVFIEAEDMTEDEDFECPYLFFSITNEVKRHGINFLNP